MFVKERFRLSDGTKNSLRAMVPEFGFSGFGEFIFYRTYSRQVCDICKSELIYSPTLQGDYCPIHQTKFDYGQESWNDCVIRVTEGVFSIRKDWYSKNSIAWNEDFWQHYANHFAESMFKMEWMPPGRGLWAMGTDFVFKRGSMALNNCGFTVIGDDIGADINWLMDSLMCGVGVGFMPERNDELLVYVPRGEYDYVIPDTREGWCEATEELINCYLKPGRGKPRFDYSQIRPAGLPIRGFGGVSSGPEPLKTFHEQISNFMDMYNTKGWYDSVLLKADIANCAGCCVVAGNVRRSAELLAANMDDALQLKNYEKYPYRESHGWMSNNSVLLSEDTDFQRLGEIAERIVENGEPGVINCLNLPFGRIGKQMNGLRSDKAIAFNPCGEQPLENKELCTLVETCPTRCETEEQWLKACEYATMYASTVTLLPTHRHETNAVMLRNRRIGVGIIDVSGWQASIGTTSIINSLREGYKRVRNVNRWVNSEAGIPEAIRVTTIKPGGTTPKLPGLRSGWQWPTFGYTLRRVRVAQNQPIFKLLEEAGIPHEPDVFSANTEVFEWPIDQSDNGKVRPATQITVWQQAMMLVLLQREWSDNAVSNTLYFKPRWNLIGDINIGMSFYQQDISDDNLSKIFEFLPCSWEHLLDLQEFVVENKLKIKLTQDSYTDEWHVKQYVYDPNHEEDDIESVLAAIVPLTKSISMLPHATVGVYRQMPEEGISKNEYDTRLAAIQKIDWSRLRHSNGVDEKYCEGPSCEMRIK